VPGELSATSFDYYEGIRIFLPGAVCVAIYGAVVATFGLNAPVPHDNALAALFASVVAGLLLLWADIPAKAAPYFAGQPHRELERDDLQLPGEMTPQNLYMTLLDTEIPAVIRNRSLYMGSIYRIGFEFIYLIFLAAIAVIAVAALISGAGPSRNTANTDVAFRVGIALFAALPLTAALLRARARKKSVVSVVARVPGELGIGTGIADGVAAALVVFEVLGGPKALAGAGLGLATLAWAHRYYRGYEGDNGRTNLSSPTSSLLFAWAGILASVIAIANLQANSAFGMAETCGWLGAALFAGLILVSRGHERKLHGSYRSQRTWIQLNLAKVRANVEPTSETDPADGQ
jgi:hypothetical protein